MKYKITIPVTIEVEANNRKEALEQAKARIAEGRIDEQAREIKIVSLEDGSVSFLVNGAMMAIAN